MMNISNSFSVDHVVLYRLLLSIMPFAVYCFCVNKCINCEPPLLWRGFFVLMESLFLQEKKKGKKIKKNKKFKKNKKKKKKKKRLIDQDFELGFPIAGQCSYYNNN